MSDCVDNTFDLFNLNTNSTNIMTTGATLSIESKTNDPFDNLIHYYELRKQPAKINNIINNISVPVVDLSNNNRIDKNKVNKKKNKKNMKPELNLKRSNYKKYDDDRDDYYNY